MSPQFLTCRLCQYQSPIDITSAISADISNLQINYKSSALNIFNNGHTIGVNYDSGSTLILDGEAYELIQFHFHHPSEHRVNGKSYPMELHLVHKSERGSLAVVGIFLQTGKENQTLQAIWQMMPPHGNTETKISDVTINVQDFIPQSQQFYRYYGSLTTPPCSENLNWIVFQEPVEMSTAQIQQFAQLFPMNPRPVKRLNRRCLLRTGGNEPHL